MLIMNRPSRQNMRRLRARMNLRRNLDQGYIETLDKRGNKFFRNRRDLTEADRERMNRELAVIASRIVEDAENVRTKKDRSYRARLTR